MISVIIPTKNNADKLDICLRSLKNQTYKNFEIIVIDGSDDSKTKMVCKKYNVRFFFEKKKSRSAACNKGIKHARGDIIIFTDDDCELPEDWLSKILEKFKNDTNLMVCGGNDVLKSGNKIQKALYCIDVFNENKNKDIYKNNPWKRIRGCNSAYRKDVFKLELFDEKMSSIEETELHFRLKKHGLKMCYDSNIIVFHARRKTLHEIWKRFFINGKNRAMFVKKHKFFDTMDKVSIILPLIAFSILILSPILLLMMFFLYIVFTSLIISLKTDKKFFTTLIPVLCVRNFAFVIGFWKGIFSIYQSF